MEEANKILMQTITEKRAGIQVMNNNLMKILEDAPAVLQRLEERHEQLASCLKSIEDE